MTTPCNATPGRKPSAFNFRTKAKGLMHLGSIEMIRLDTVDSPTVKGNMCFFSCSDSWNFAILLHIVDTVFTYDGFLIIYVLERASGAKIKSIRFISSILEALKETNLGSHPKEMPTSFCSKLLRCSSASSSGLRCEKLRSFQVVEWTSMDHSDHR